MQIQRYMSDELLEAFKKDSGFCYLLNKVKSSNGELDLQFRENYFDLYFRGNRLANIHYKLKEGNILYTIEIHKTFCEKDNISNNSLEEFLNKNENKNFIYKYRKNSKKEITHYIIHKIIGASLELLFENNIEVLCKKIINRKFSEERYLEQLIISDNLNRKDIIIIDRQIQRKECIEIKGKLLESMQNKILDKHIKDLLDKGYITRYVLKNKLDELSLSPEEKKLILKNIRACKMDILALKQIKDNHYNFLIIEIKLGKNPELTEKVINQINTYEEDLFENFEVYKKCYEENYKQKKLLGLFNGDFPNEIIIENKMESILVVGNYPNIAKNNLKALSEKEKGKELLSKTLWIENENSDMKIKENNLGINQEKLFKNYNETNSKITGEVIYNSYKNSNEKCKIKIIGKRGGINGKEFKNDLISGKWKMQRYRISLKEIIPNNNWFTIEDFVNKIEQN